MFHRQWPKPSRARGVSTRVCEAFRALRKEQLMCLNLPTTVFEFMDWSWSQIEPYFHDLAARPLNAEKVTAWLADWTHLSLLLQETYQRLYVATTVNTEDEEASTPFPCLPGRYLPAGPGGGSNLEGEAAEQRSRASGVRDPHCGIYAPRPICTASRTCPCWATN